MWVGTGESWTRNSVSVGNGVYKSTDGGETLDQVGPARRTERITRILVHPKNGNIVYVCAPGALWSDSPDRGLYKTTDGGKTWSLILKGANLSTGCSSVAMDPANPEHLLAGTWDFRRKAYEFRSGGNGPDAPSGSRFAESRDGGRTWTDLDATTARACRSSPGAGSRSPTRRPIPKRVYAFIENVRPALFVSDDGGKTWEERDRSQGMVWRPFYFGRLVVDPKNPDRLFKMGYSMIVSDDGGKSFANAAGGTHGDWHDLWIDPTNTKHIVGGDDGGLWYQLRRRQPLVEERQPAGQPVLSCQRRQQGSVPGLWRPAGQQRLGRRPGISGRHHQQPLGKSLRRRRLLGVRRSVRPRTMPMPRRRAATSARVNRKTLAGARYPAEGRTTRRSCASTGTRRSQLSPNEKGTLYIGSQFLFRSRDHGVTWDRISPDLTTNDPVRQRQEQSGGITVDNSRGRDEHDDLLDLGEPEAAGEIWVGTDDGNVQLTRDGGAHWTNVTAEPRTAGGQLDQLGRGEPLRSGGRLRRPTTATLSATWRHTSTARPIMGARGSGSSVPERRACAAMRT